MHRSAKGGFQSSTVLLDAQHNEVFDMARANHAQSGAGAFPGWTASPKALPTRAQSERVPQRYRIDRGRHQRRGVASRACHVMRCTVRRSPWRVLLRRVSRCLLH